MIHLPPLGMVHGVVKRVYWWFKSKLFWKTIYASHKRWLERTGLGSDSDKMGDDIECSVSSARWPEGPEESRIAFRTENGRRFDAITFVVEALGGKFDYDATGTISFVSDQPRYTTLPGFPAYRTYASEDSVTVPYSGYRVRITQVTENGVSKSVRFSTPIYHPIDQTLANADDWKSWAGTPVNVELIRDKQNALKTRLWKKLGHPQLGLGNRYSGVPRILYPIVVVMLSDTVIRSLFWLGIATGRIKIDSKDEDE
jgi:hypothetical protein